jgi:prevent-host-death family protein
MALIGIRELRESASEVLRRVREEKAEYVITYQGQPVAVILPVDSELVKKAMLDASKQSALSGMDTYLRLAETLRKDWPADQSTQSLIDEVRKA